MAHAFVSGATPSDSERVITVGGVDSVAAGVFTGCGFDYLALGHLHRPQNVTIPQPDGKHMNVFHFGRTPQARYSGSLLAYSFSEAPRSPQVGNGKQVTIVDFGGEEGNHEAGQGKPVIETRAVQSEQPAMVSIAGTLDEVLSQADLHQKDWVSVTVQYDEYPQHLYERIDGKYPFALEKRAVCTRVRNTERAMADLTAYGTKWMCSTVSWNTPSVVRPTNGRLQYCVRSLNRYGPSARNIPELHSSMA